MFLTVSLEIIKYSSKGWGGSWRKFWRCCVSSHQLEIKKKWDCEKWSVRREILFTSTFQNTFNVRGLRFKKNIYILYFIYILYSIFLRVSDRGQSLCLGSDCRLYISFSMIFELFNLRDFLRKGTLIHCWWEYKLVQPLVTSVWKFLRGMEV
jgi:hypothetical protein